LYLNLILKKIRRKPWAVVMGIVVAAVHGIAGLVVIAVCAWALNKVGPVVLIPAGAALVLVCVAIFLLCRISQLLMCLHELDPQETGRFEPILRPTDAARVR
jgi:hypothetical protein